MHDIISLDYLEDSGVPGAKTAEGYAEHYAKYRNFT